MPEGRDDVAGNDKLGARMLGTVDGDEAGVAILDAVDEDKAGAEILDPIDEDEPTLKKLVIFWEGVLSLSVDLLVRLVLLEGGWPPILTCWRRSLCKSYGHKT
jgi:hypothetical protein